MLRVLPSVDSSLARLLPHLYLPHGQAHPEDADEIMRASGGDENESWEPEWFPRLKLRNMTAELTSREREFEAWREEGTGRVWIKGCTWLSVMINESYNLEAYAHLTLRHSLAAAIASLISRISFSRYGRFAPRFLLAPCSNASLHRVLHSHACSPRALTFKLPLSLLSPLSDTLSLTHTHTHTHTPHTHTHTRSLFPSQLPV